MKLKIFLLFLLVFTAIGQTIVLNIDAKSNFLWENSEKLKNSTTHSSNTDLDNSSVQTPEVVVTIRQHDSEVLNQNANINLDLENKDVNSDTKENTNTIQSTTKKPCSQITKEERLVCQKAKEAAKQKRNAGSNHSKNSTIQTPAP